jgi:hypothetical protein
MQRLPKRPLYRRREMAAAGRLSALVVQACWHGLAIRYPNSTINLLVNHIGAQLGAVEFSTVFIGKRRSLLTHMYRHIYRISMDGEKTYPRWRFNVCI